MLDRWLAAGKVPSAHRLERTTNNGGWAGSAEWETVFADARNRLVAGEFAIARRLHALSTTAEDPTRGAAADEMALLAENLGGETLAVIPPGYHAETRVRGELIVSGAATFGAFYLLSVLVAPSLKDSSKRCTDDYVVGNKCDSGERLYIPIAGPFLQMSNSQNANSTTGNLVLAFDGISQAVGVTLLIVGLTSPRTVLVRNGRADVRVTPMRMANGRAGLGLVGAF